MSDPDKPKGKPGRPKSQATLDREQDAKDGPRIAEMLANPPRRAKRKKKVLGKEWLMHAQKVKEQIERTYVIGNVITPERAYVLESIRDESVSEVQNAAELKWHEDLSNRLREGQAAGGSTTATKAYKRAIEVCAHNAVLIASLPIPRVIEKIHREWHSVPPGGLLVGESPTIARRGVGGEAPSQKTIGRYLQKVITSSDKAPSK